MGIQSAQRIILVALLLALLVVPGASAQANRPKNVIFILSDDHRYDAMGFMHTQEFIKTPALDRMAAGGAHVQNAFVSTALCSPSRASILTGQYAHRHGVVDNNTAIPKGTVFFPQLLQKAGYRTAFFGKWHMGGEGDDPQPGFTHWVSFRGQGPYRDPVLNVDGKRGKVQGYTTDILTDMALDWIKQNQDKPFFVYLSHKAVHAPFDPADRHRDRALNAPIRYPETMADTDVNYRGKPLWVREQRFSHHGVDYMYHGNINFDTFIRRYAETLMALDESVGRVLDYVEQSGLSKNTLVIYMGDNGFSFGEHGLIDKRHAYEESMRVPMLAYAPGYVKPGTKITPMVVGFDIGPTVLELAGVETPSNMDGRSFVPLLEGRQVPWRTNLMYEYYWERNYPQTPTVFAIRTDQYKYIYYQGIWDTDELYDLKADPLEKVNLVNNPEHRERVAQLRKDLFDQLDATGGMQIPLRPPRGEMMDIRKNH